MRVALRTRRAFFRSDLDLGEDQAAGLVLQSAILEGKQLQPVARRPAGSRRLAAKANAQLTPFRIG
jgi:hypothetical protein